jgi:hypothetical protein
MEVRARSGLAAVAGGALNPVRRAAAVLLWLALAGTAEAKTVAILKEWRGRVDAAPDLPGFVTNAAELSAIWTHLKVPGEIPKVDFRKQLVLAVAVRSSVVRMRPELDEAGNLKRNVIATPDQPAFFSYVLCLVSSAGVSMVDAVPTNAAMGCRDLTLTLRAAEVVRAGTAPAFALRIRNDAKQPRSILDVRGGRRNDLQAVYFPVAISRDGRPVEVPRRICDPGPVSAEDYFALAPGAIEEIPLAQTCLDLTKLSPGKYEARATLRSVYTTTDPACETPPVAFEVRK